MMDGREVIEPTVEPAGNLKGKFAGWLALVLLLWSSQVSAHCRMTSSLSSL